MMGVWNWHICYSKALKWMGVNVGMLSGLCRNDLEHQFQLINQVHMRRRQGPKMVKSTSQTNRHKPNITILGTYY